MREDFLYLPRIHRQVNSFKITPISVADLSTLINEIRENSNRLIDYPAQVTCERMELGISAQAFNIKLTLKKDWEASNKKIWAVFFPDQKSQENLTLAFGIEKTSGDVNEIITNMQPWLFRMVLMLSPTASTKLMPSLEQTDYWLDAPTLLFGYQIQNLKTILHMQYPKIADIFLDRINSDTHLEFFALQSDQSIMSWLKKSCDTNPAMSQAINTILKPVSILIKMLKDTERNVLLNDLFQMPSPTMRQEYYTIIPRFNQNSPDIYKTKYFQKAMKNNKERLEKLAHQLGLKINDPNFINEFSNPLSELSILYVEKEIVGQMQQANILPTNTNECTGTALFVGEGFGGNMLAIQKAYPNLKCYALEPDIISVTRASACGIKKNQQFHATMELIPQACYGTFNFVFVFNYNIRFSQDDFFKRISDLLKHNGKIIVGKAMSDPQHISSNKTIHELLKQTFTNFSLPDWNNGVPNLEFKQALYQATKTESKTLSIKESTKQTPLEQWLNNKISAENKEIEDFIKELNKEALMALNPPPKTSEALATFGLLATTKPSESEDTLREDLSIRL